MGRSPIRWVIVPCIFQKKNFIFIFYFLKDGPLRIEALTTGAMSTISKIIRLVSMISWNDLAFMFSTLSTSTDCLQVEDAQGREAPIQRLADQIAGPFVYSVMLLSVATSFFW